MPARKYSEGLYERIRKLDVHTFNSAQEWLQAVYSELQKESALEEKSFTLRDFSIFAGYGGSNIMHQYLKGHRKISLKSLKKILDNFALEPKQKKLLCALHQVSISRSPHEIDSALEKMIRVHNEVLPSTPEAMTLKFLEAWLNPILLEMAQDGILTGNLREIRNCLVPKVTNSQVIAALSSLQELGLVKWDVAKGRFAATRKEITTGHHVAGFAFQKIQNDLIDLGKDAVRAIPANERHISTVTVSLTAEHFELIREKIKELLELAMKIRRPADDDKRSKSSVYQLNLQFFPVTRRPEDD